MTLSLGPQQARALAGAIEAVDGVAKLHAGDYGHIALLYPGFRVPGLRLDDSTGRPVLQVHLCIDVDAHVPVSRIADNVRETVHATLAATLAPADAPGTAGAAGAAGERGAAGAIGALGAIDIIFADAAHAGGFAVSGEPVTRPTIDSTKDHGED